MCLTITFSPLILCKIMKKTEKMFLGGKGAGPNGEEVEAAAAPGRERGDSGQEALASLPSGVGWG